MSKIINVTESSFDQLIADSKNRVVVDFWAPWCGPCKQLTPIIEAVVQEQDNLVLGKVNVDDEMALANRYHVKGLPTLLLFENGELLATHVGLASKEKLTAFVKQEDA